MRTRIIEDMDYCIKQYERDGYVNLVGSSLRQTHKCTKLACNYRGLCTVKDPQVYGYILTEISSHILWWLYLFIHAGIKVKSFSKMGAM